MPVRTRTNPGSVLGIDVGGANLKAATADGRALSVPFALWREPKNLAKRLREIVRQLQFDRLAITMTGELCDCFATKREGVHAILDSVVRAAPKRSVQVWSTCGRFVTLEEARAEPLRVAAANWHALATFAGRFVAQGAGLLVDIGSTTTDVIPLWEGRPVSKGLTDSGRLAAGELLYTGVRRTPVSALLGQMTVAELGHAVAAELFATMHDVYLVLGLARGEPLNCDTADGRPATRAAAHARLARMSCHDVARFSWGRARRFAREILRYQRSIVEAAINKVAARLPQSPGTIVLSGIGDSLAGAALRCLPRGFRVIALRKKLSPAVSAAACAYALAVLGEEVLSAEC